MLKSRIVGSAKKSLVKTMLRNVVQKMQDLARRGDSNAGGRPRPNGTTVNGHTNEVKFQIVTIFINILYLETSAKESPSESFGTEWKVREWSFCEWSRGILDYNL